MHNALDAISAHPELTYAEGFALADDNKLFQHAWVVDASGLAIEVTIPDDVEVAYFGVSLRDPRRDKALWPLHTLARKGGPFPDPLIEEQLRQRELGLPT
jgi:hypothetical protein